ncbi:probable glutamate receptor [Palaemon carinicauda]|uniref:probable glutamate receptor n=1 Tax=Palaemon carinicauda TaxID=392227 RepID=UPI0035B668B9
MERSCHDRPEVLNARAQLVWMWVQGISARRISRLTGFSTTTVYSKSSFINLKTMEAILHFLDTVSPPHQLYVFFDVTFQDLANSVSQYHNNDRYDSVMNVLIGNDVKDDIFSPEWTSAKTNRRHIFVFCTLNNLENLFQMISAKNLESRWTWWIILAIEKNVSTILTQLMREGSQVILIDLEDQNHPRLLSSRVDATSLIRFHNAVHLKITPRGYESEVQMDVFEPLEKLYADFQGRQLTVTAVIDQPYILFERLDNGELLPVSGFEYAVIKSLAETLNFTIRMIEPADGKWGGPLPNGTVVGMIGVVARREAHFAMCDISITGVREQVIDFTYPHYIESLTLISRAPMEKNRSFAAFEPFTFMTWIWIIAALLIIGSVVSVESWLVEIYLPERNNKRNLSDSLFNMFRSLLKQENLLPDVNFPQKLTFLFWYMFCLIISVLYSGMLTATLIKPSFEKPINALTDLPAAIKEGFTLVVTADTSMEYMFKQAKSGIYADTWKLFNHKDRSKSFKQYSVDYYNKIVEDKLVIVSPHLIARYHSAKLGSSHFYLARDTFAPQYYGAPCFQGSPYVPAFNKMFSSMIEGGLMTKWVENEFAQVSGNNIITQQSGLKPYTIKQLQAGFYVLVIGFLVSAISFTLEVFVFYMKTS